ncbi:MAG: flagellin [Betaproteobacteria bacterium]|nr:flagellin [Betaproteobacteria bacterium]
MASSVINTNIISLDAQLNLNRTQSQLATAVQRLSSGLRINSSADDAAGYSISQRMTAQINGMNQAAQNANDGISLAQTAGGALQSVDDALQRMRTLALESANSTNSSTDRQSLNAEAQQLLAEIQRVATTTQFNGLSLLDGSFQGAQFQVGANANQTINVSISSATTTSLGSYGGTGTSVTTGGAASNAWTASSTISINGASVGASVANASVAGWNAGSAAAKAAAINAVTSSTGVSATATNSVTGSAPVADQSLLNGDLSINGISIGPVAAQTTAQAQGSALAAAINAASAQTGVTATSDVNSGALTLTATDGRDIELTSANASAATKLMNLGLTAHVGGTGAAKNVQTLTFGGTAPANGSTVTVNGVTFTFDTSTTSNSVVDATNVTVGIKSLAAGDAISSQFAAAYTLAAGSTAPTFAALQPVSASDNGSGVVSLTDSRYGTTTTTGWTVAANGTGTTNIAYATSTTGADLSSISSNNYYNGGTITLNSSQSFTLANAGTAGSTGLADAGLNGLTPGLTSLSTLDISTVAGSNNAISLIDAALDQVNSAQAELGAVQNRFTNTVSNLQTTSLNLTSARSRITDADFAQETANMARAQILQQAGTAMVAQANQLPNLVLKLLP